MSECLKETLLVPSLITKKKSMYTIFVQSVEIPYIKDEVMNFKVLIMFLFLFPVTQGCAGFSEIDWNPGPPQGSIIMSEGEEININSITNKTNNGTDITKFYCSAGIKKCSVAGSQKSCRCETGPIYLPPRLWL